MPHVTVKVWPGKTEDQKKRLAEAIARDVMEILDYGSDSVSVSIEEVAPARWKEEVFLPDIQAAGERLYKKPGYRM